ncbi:MAG: HSP90 family protein [Gordonia sp. (in: high G+C Gram-positive bacteria)]
MDEVTGNAGIFDVDLRALIDVLGTNLYSSPAVYVRELLQNAIDAQAVAGRPEAEIAITVDDGVFTIDDHGAGMTAGQIGELLGTIGRSSKRDALGFSAEETIGQFGVGMLSGFLVGDRIEVSSRSAGSDSVTWVGDAAGSVQTGAGDRADVGTTVRITARPGMGRWLSPVTVAQLAAEYTALHPTPVTVNGERVNGAASPIAADDAGLLAAARIAYCQDEFGFTPLESFDVEVPEAALRGVAFVRPRGGDFVARNRHRVYVKGLLVGDVAELLPEWAYFVQVVVDAPGLTPTASRENVVRDDLFGSVSESLGAQILDWLGGLERRPALRGRFLEVHEQGIKALTAHRPELLGFVDRHCAFETNFGPQPLATFRARFKTLRYTDNVDDFRVLADVLTGRGFGLVNAGYSFESAVVRALVDHNPGIVAEYVTQDVLLSALGSVDAETRDRFSEATKIAERAVAPFGCDVELASFDPATLSSVYVTDDSARLAADRKQMLSETSGEPDAWLAALAAVDAASPTVESRPILVLNTANSLVSKLPEVHNATVVGAVIRAIYSQALIRARRSLGVDAASEIDSAITLLADLAATASKNADHADHED